MLDESISHAKPSDWPRVILLEKHLVDLIGSKNFEHILPNPIDGLQKIARELHGESFSSIIDLTGWLSPAFRSIFPDTPIITAFSLSRVRVVSSPNLETSGYSVSISEEDIEAVRNRFDFGKTLILDDTTFTGWTSCKTMELWKLDPENTTHAFLIANTGKLGIKSKEEDPEPPPGAVELIESKGSKVVFGHGLATPHEDGWHLKDLHQHPNIPESFFAGIELLKLIDRYGANSIQVSLYLKDERKQNLLFPERICHDEITKLANEGRFIETGKFSFNSNGIIHTKNPLLWASRYFREHLDLDEVEKNKNLIAAILVDLKNLTEYPEAKLEASLELRRVLQGHLMFGKERK